MKSDLVAQFMDKWLCEEFFTRIQHARRALAPKSKSGQPPRSIAINFQQWKGDDTEKKGRKKTKTKKQSPSRKHDIFDHDYSERMLQQWKAHSNIKEILNREGIRFQTLLNKIHLHWASGVKTYGSAEEAASDLRWGEGMMWIIRGPTAGEPHRLKGSSRPGTLHGNSPGVEAPGEASRRTTARISTEGNQHRMS